MSTESPESGRWRDRIAAAVPWALIFAIVVPLPGALLHSASKGFGFDSLLIVFFSWLIWGPAGLATGLVAGFAIRLRTLPLLVLCTATGALAFWIVDRWHDWLPHPAFYGALGAFVAALPLAWKKLVDVDAKQARDD